ncbi:uracil-DNA glycosylase [Arthrobacter sulfonylureivorans]|uniref:uracil-DNA glycosylase n=1 Tax=Arthrobacter sulfonylureivorans TaxID=2486855 RepID=UPI0039E4C755
MFADKPQSLADPNEQQQRKAMLHTAPAIQELEEWREEFAKTRTEPVPHFDPADAGSAARVLFLLDSPGAATVTAEEPGFVSVDNPDQAAERCWTERNDAELHDGIVLWNTVPFFLDGAEPTPVQTIAGVKALKSVLGLLPRLEVVVLCGTFTKAQWAKHMGAFSKPTVIKAPSPGSRGMISKKNQEDFRQAVRRAKRLVG